MKKILFIDDNHELRKITLEALELEGFQTIGAEDGKQGIAIAKTQKPDIILCDIMMPETDGFEVYNHLRQDQSTAMTPFIFLTALAEKEYMRKGMEIGADDYLTKPFKLEELLNSINIRLQKSELINERIEAKLKELRENLFHKLPYELLNPIHGILAYSSILQEDSNSLTRSEMKDLARDIESYGQHLNDLIHNFLNYIRITAAETADNKRVLLENIDQIIAGIATNIALKYGREKDLILQLENTDIAMVDEDFVFVIRELVDNAFKFSEPKSNVVVTNTVQNNFVEIRITDHGMGFPLEHIQDFEALDQFNRETKEQHGAALGLITAMLIVQRHQGTLNITNDKLGALVVLKLPLTPSVKQMRTI
jgi:DNA-binding response OmpR family regulator/anti-sigma regulatory factor (Ser/Thr protein kinase)